jgi:hypothetical protein
MEPSNRKANHGRTEHNQEKKDKSPIDETAAA